MQKIFESFVGILILPFVLILIPILNALGLNSVNSTPEDVLSYLNRMSSGEIDERWWDDFLNVPIKNADLDQIRQRCDDVWDPSAGFLTRNYEGVFELNEVGHQRVKELIAQTEEIKDVAQETV